jgi:acetylornithine deacetylase/succinyl-diaminopimelate desuccinylase-like protein
MPIKPVKAALEVLAHDSRLDRPASETISYLMDLLYYGDFRILQQVASADDHDYVNLIGAKGPSQGKKPLWLISTVATGQLPAPGHWERTNGNPFNPTIDEEWGLLYGMGASSGKVDFICKLLAASTVGREELNRPLYVIGLFGEEARATGLGSVLDLSGGEGGYALIGAPTNLELCRTHPGLVSLRIRLNREVRHRRMPPIRGIFRLLVSGRSAHAQWPGLATNALERGFQVLETLKKEGDIRILSVTTDRGANRIPGSCELIIATTYDNLPQLPPDVTIEALGDGVSVPFPVDGLIAFWERGKRAIEKAFKETSLLGEGAVIPAERRVHFGELVSDRDSLSGTLTFWTGDITDPMAIAAQVAECFQQAPRKGDLIDVEIQVIQDRPHFEATTENSPFLEGAQAVLNDQGLAPITSQGIITTDAGLLRQEGIETLVFGPGSTGASLYRDNEAIPLRHIEACYQFYVELIRRLCLK